MGLFGEWLETLQNVVTSPSEFFSEETRRDGFGFPFKFAAVSLLVAGVLQGIRTALYATVLSSFGGAASAGLSAMAVVTSLIGTVIGGLIGLIIGAAILHLFVMLLGGDEGYSETLSVLGYATALSPITALASFVPILGGLVGLLLWVYGIFIQAKGLESFQSMSFGKAVLAILLPAIILIVLAVVVLLVALGGSLAALSGAGVLGA